VNEIFRNYCSVVVVPISINFFAAAQSTPARQAKALTLKIGFCSIRTGTGGSNLESLGPFADIGTYWCDMAEHVTGPKITSVSANLETLSRLEKSQRIVETFQGRNLRPDEYTNIPINTEDFGSRQFKMGLGTFGCMTTNQLPVSRKGQLFLEICGSKCFCCVGCRTSRRNVDRSAGSTE
jgi:hypothetical protein